MLAYHGNNPCPWTKFYINTTNLLDTLFDEACTPHTKIAKFITAAKWRFAREPTKGKKSQKKAIKAATKPQEKAKQIKTVATR